MPLLRILSRAQCRGRGRGRREGDRGREIAKERRNEGGEAGSSDEASLETELRLGIRESREIILNKAVIQDFSWTRVLITKLINFLEAFLFRIYNSWDTCIVLL